jgi:hypothetical protein
MKAKLHVTAICATPTRAKSYCRLKMESRKKENGGMKAKLHGIANMS